MNFFICDIKAVKIVLKEKSKVAVESGNKRKSGEYNEIRQWSHDAVKSFLFDGEINKVNIALKEKKGQRGMHASFPKRLR